MRPRRAREVPLPDQAAGALDRLSQRGDFTRGDDYVFANRLGRRLDGGDEIAAGGGKASFERARLVTVAVDPVQGVDAVSHQAAMVSARRPRASAS